MNSEPVYSINVSFVVILAELSMVLNNEALLNCPRILLYNWNFII